MTRAWAAKSPREALAPFEISRREPRARDVVIDLLYCGVCHSDLHQARDEWGGSIFPMVPGHEMVGRVAHTGPAVTKFRAGDLAGVGCMVDSCRACDRCQRGFEQFCVKGCAWSYNSTEMDKRTPTWGGYSKQVVVDEQFVLRIPEGLDPAAAAPLLCAGITTYSPLKQWPAKRVAVMGLGGLGHMAVKLAASMGAEVTVLSTSRRKEADARRLGANHFATDFTPLRERFDLLIDTVSAEHDLNAALDLLSPLGTMVVVGIPPNPAPLKAGALIHGNRRIAGSLIGGIRETQEMLDYCGARGIVSDVEVIPIQQINEAWERMLKGDVRYRFVIDLATL